MSEIYTKVLIIGSGPAGYSAAVYAVKGRGDPISADKSAIIIKKE